MYIRDPTPTPSDDLSEESDSWVDVAREQKEQARRTDEVVLAPAPESVKKVEKKSWMSSVGSLFRRGDGNAEVSKHVEPRSEEERLVAAQAAEQAKDDEYEVVEDDPSDEETDMYARWEANEKKRKEKRWWQI